MTCQKWKHSGALIFLRYIFSPRITSYIEISDATLSLATCCVHYLCQRHHDTDLSDDELRNNILLGIYRFHDYSATMWLELLERYIRTTKSTSLPNDIINLFQMFVEKRSSDEFIKDTVLPAIQTLSQRLFSEYPGVHEMLSNAASFQKKCSEGEYNAHKG